MWNSSVSGHGVGGSGAGLWGVSPSVASKERISSDKDDVKKLLGELDDAERTSSNQTARDLRDKLNEKRMELGDTRFKEILEQINKEIAQSWLALLRRLFPDLFPGDEPSPSPAPQPSPGRGGVGDGGNSGRVNPSRNRPAESMSSKPLTKGANYHHYRPDNSEPGKKPGMGREDGNIWSGFKQGPDGNCVTVSAIKAAMMKFGQKPTDIFKEVKAAGDGFDVQMRDGYRLHLSQAEVKQAAEQARFEGDNPAMLTDANFLFAVSAKRAQNENNDGYARQSFTAALQSLNDGEDGGEGLMRLGLSGHMRKTTASELASGQLGVVSHQVMIQGEWGGHSLAVIGGREEMWGKRGWQPPAGAEAFALV